MRFKEWMSQSELNEFNKMNLIAPVMAGAMALGGMANNSVHAQDWGHPEYPSQTAPAKKAPTSQPTTQQAVKDGDNIVKQLASVTDMRKEQLLVQLVGCIKKEMDVGDYYNANSWALAGAKCLERIHRLTRSVKKEDFVLWQVWENKKTGNKFWLTTNGNVIHPECKQLGQGGWQGFSGKWVKEGDTITITEKNGEWPITVLNDGNLKWFDAIQTRVGTNLDGLPLPPIEVKK